MTTNKKIKCSKIFKFFFNKSSADTLFTLLIFAIIFLIISNPTRYTTGTILGLKLFVFSVLPGLFPFMLLTKLITEIGLIFNISQKFDKFSYKVFGTPGVSLYAFLMSILSGYPIGAKIISDLYEKKQINEAEAKKMSVFCTTSGPIFVIGTVGTIMFNSFKIGLILYFSHILSSLFLGIAYNLITKKTQSSHAHKNTIFVTHENNIISKCVNQTINSLFVVGAYITIFYLLSELLESIYFFKFLSTLLFPILSKFGLNQNCFNGLIYGILEVTRGAKTLSFLATNSSIIITSGILSFSGLSIIMQSLAFLKTAKIKAHNFIFSKCVHSCVSMFFCLILLFIFIWRSLNISNCTFKFVTVASNNV